MQIYSLPAWPGISGMSARPHHPERTAKVILSETD
jgi:hypothetical protein